MVCIIVGGILCLVLFHTVPRFRGVFLSAQFNNNNEDMIKAKTIDAWRSTTIEFCRADILDHSIEVSTDRLSVTFRKDENAVRESDHVLLVCRPITNAHGMWIPKKKGLYQLSIHCRMKTVGAQKLEWKLFGQVRQNFFLEQIVQVEHDISESMVGKEIPLIVLQSTAESALFPISRQLLFVQEADSPSSVTLTLVSSDVKKID